MIRFTRVAIGVGCERVCARCEPPHAEEYAPLSDIRARIEAVAQSDSAACENILLDGPEPFRHPVLPAIIEACVQAGAKRIGLVTDAGALSIGENAAGSLTAGLRQIHVPLFGPDAASHDALTPSGRFDQTLAGVTGFLTAADRMGVPVVLLGVLPLCDHTLTHAPAIIATFARLGAVAVRVVVSDSALLGAPELLAAVETGITNGVWVWVDAESRAATPPAPGALDARPLITIRGGGQ